MGPSEGGVSRSRAQEASVADPGTIERQASAYLHSRRNEALRSSGLKNLEVHSWGARLNDFNFNPVLVHHVDTQQELRCLVRDAYLKTYI